MIRPALAMACLMVIAGCSEPLYTIPGGELAGPEREAPGKWSQVPDTIQLETRPTEPYSINIWAVAMGGDLYVATGPEGANWTPYIEADPGVRVRFDEELYPLRAVLVDDADEHAQVTAVYEEKYGMGTDWVATSMMFRLERP